MSSYRQYINHASGTERSIVVRISGEAFPEEDKKAIRRFIVALIGRPVRTLFRIGCNWISIDDARSCRWVSDWDVREIVKIVSETASARILPAPTYAIDNTRRRQSV